MGMATFSSSRPPTPPAHPAAMAASHPATWQATWMTDSQITGLTLPGMMELPGCTAGRISSPNPHRGPEPSRRTSEAILPRVVATPRSAPEANSAASRLPCAAKRSLGSRSGRPVRWARMRQTSAANPSGALSPVPTAVPPIGSSQSPSTA